VISLKASSYCNTVEWFWWDWSLSQWPTGFLQCFDAVGWVIWPVEFVPEMTYEVSSGTLSLYSLTDWSFLSCGSTRRHCAGSYGAASSKSLWPLVSFDMRISSTVRSFECLNLSTSFSVWCYIFRISESPSSFKVMELISRSQQQRSGHTQVCAALGRSLMLRHRCVLPSDAA